MWDQTQIMAGIAAAKADHGGDVVTVEASVLGDVLRLAFRDAGAVLLASYSVTVSGDSMTATRTDGGGD